MFGPRVFPESETRARLGCSAAIDSMSLLRRLRTEFGGGRSWGWQWGNKRRPFSNNDERNAKPTSNISKNRQLMRDPCTNLFLYAYAYANTIRVFFVAACELGAAENRESDGDFIRNISISRQNNGMVEDHSTNSHVGFRFSGGDGDWNQLWFFWFNTVFFCLSSYYPFFKTESFS